jgi:hypothetical protein
MAATARRADSTEQARCFPLFFLSFDSILLYRRGREKMDNDGAVLP